MRVNWLDRSNELHESVEMHESVLSCTYWSFDVYGVYLSWAEDNEKTGFFILLSWDEASEFSFFD